MPIPDGEELEDGQLACSTGPAGLVAIVGLFVRPFVCCCCPCRCCPQLVLLFLGTNQIVKLGTRSCLHIIHTAQHCTR